MRILHLHLKAQWYDMIERGEKREEYRARSAYWIARLCEWRYMPNAHTIVVEHVTMDAAREIAIEELDTYQGVLFTKRYDAVRFSYGYTKRNMLWECSGISIGRGREEWGAPNHETFIIKLGKQIR